MNSEIPLKNLLEFVESNLAVKYRDGLSGLNIRFAKFYETLQKILICISLIMEKLKKDESKNSKNSNLYLLLSNCWLD